MAPGEAARAVEANLSEEAVRRAAEAAGQREVAAPLQEVLRGVGDNVVREVLALPRAAEQARARHDEERRQMDAGHAREIEALAAANATLHALDSTRERHAAELQELIYRTTAAEEGWRAHIQEAREKLELRDSELLAKHGAPFWAMVGWSSERPITWSVRCASIRPPISTRRFCET